MNFAQLKPSLRRGPEISESVYEQLAFNMNVIEYQGAQQCQSVVVLQ